MNNSPSKETTETSNQIEYWLLRWQNILNQYNKYIKYCLKSKEKGYDKKGIIKQLECFDCDVYILLRDCLKEINN